MEFLRLVMLFWDAKVDERTHRCCWIHRLPLIRPIRGKYTVYRPHMIIWTWFILGVWSTWGALEAPVDHVGPKVDQWSLHLRLATLLHVKVRSMLFLLATFEDEALIMGKVSSRPGQKLPGREWIAVIAKLSFPDPGVPFPIQHQWVLELSDEVNITDESWFDVSSSWRDPVISLPWLWKNG